jgi:hypothetical protein
MDTQVEMHLRRITDLELHIDKLNSLHSEEKLRLQDDLDLEREKVLQLQKLELQLSLYKKKLEETSDLQDSLADLEFKLRDKDETIRSLEGEA